MGIAIGWEGNDEVYVYRRRADPLIVSRIPEQVTINCVDYIALLDLFFSLYAHVRVRE